MRDKIENAKLKGVNLGGWLLMEGYILGGRNIPESNFKNAFRRRYGKRGLCEFENSFRGSFITDRDLKNIAEMNADVIRVPFHYRLIEQKPFSYSDSGFRYLDNVFQWAERYGIGVILDLHAAAGAQNCDWHSDSKAAASLWDDKDYRERTYALWETVADRFKGQGCLVGYDILNEPVLGSRNIKILKDFYRVLIKRIKAVDKKHLIFLEGDMWAQKIGFLKELLDDNICVSIHTYQPLNFTFNFTPFYRFPGSIDKVKWDKERLYEYLEPYAKFSAENKVKIFVGEFGINWRGGNWGELNWLDSILSLYDEFNFDYTYWTYKAVASSIFPDGIYQYIPNSPYINRGGFDTGWESYLRLWRSEKEKMKFFWQTKNYTANEGLIGVLQKHFINGG